jgi:hypothetical protein
MIGEIEVCLFDLYKIVQPLGGAEMITEIVKWDEIVLRFGFANELRFRLKGVYEKYLNIMDTFYDLMKTLHQKWKLQQRNVEYQKGKTWMQALQRVRGKMGKQVVIQFEENSMFDAQVICDDGENIILTIEADNALSLEEYPEENGSSGVDQEMTANTKGSSNMKETESTYQERED